MTSTPPPEPGRMREVLEPTSGLHLQFDFAEQLEQLRREQPWQSGRNSKTIVKYPDFRIVIVAMLAGSHMPGHHADGRLSLQTIEGRIRLRLPRRTVDLAAGQMLVLDRTVPHDVEALADSAFLLTIAWAGTAHAPLPRTDEL